MSRQCPRCQVAFEQVKKPFATIDTCPKCGALFLDPGEGAALRGADSDPTFLVRDGRATKVGAGELICPNTSHASRALDVYTIGHGEQAVEIDHCGECGGVFLDRGESEAIEQAVGGMGASVPVERTSFASPPGSNQQRAIEEARASSPDGFFSNLLTRLVGGAAEGMSRADRYGRRHRRH